MTRYIFRCQKKGGCGNVWGFDYEERRGKNSPPTRLWKRPSDGAEIQIEPASDQRGGCPKCGIGGVLSNRVVGVFSHAVGCDARCRESVTGKCTCACGGANHGSAYMPAKKEPIWAETAGRIAELQAEGRAIGRAFGDMAAKACDPAEKT